MGNTDRVQLQAGLASTGEFGNKGQFLPPAKRAWIRSLPMINIAGRATKSEVHSISGAGQLGWTQSIVFALLPTRSLDAASMCSEKDGEQQISFETLCHRSN